MINIKEVSKIFQSFQIPISMISSVITLFILSLFIVLPAQGEVPYPIAWSKQSGSLGTEWVSDVAVDSGGNAYVVGATTGDLDGNVSAGGFDIFLTKYSMDGIKLWTKLLGTSVADYGRGVAVDSGDNVYVTGYTAGDLDGNVSAGGGADLFITKYSMDGIKIWTRQLGSSEFDVADDVAVDSGGNAYVVGETQGNLDGNMNAGYSDLYITKYTTDGVKLWTRQLGTKTFDYAYGVAVDLFGNAYVVGETRGHLDGNTNAGYMDFFITKYTTDGIKLWTNQFGTSAKDCAYGVEVDSVGNAYVTGYTYGGLDGNTNAGHTDLFIVKYSTDGTKLWTDQLGSSGWDEARGVAVDSVGNAFVTGYTDGGLDGNTNAGYEDPFIVKYTTDGVKLWTSQFGTLKSEVARDVAVDSVGNVYFTGKTPKAFMGYDEDFFVMKLATPVIFSFPVPDIKTNGLDGPITITPTETLSVTVTLDSVDSAGRDADWWVLADTPFGWYRYNVGTDSWVPGSSVTYQTPLFDLATREVLNMTGLPVGTYTLSFEVDMTMNAIKDAPLYSDSVEVTVAP